jgi:hypothetical protein
MFGFITFVFILWCLAVVAFVMHTRERCRHTSTWNNYGPPPETDEEIATTYRKYARFP